MESYKEYDKKILKKLQKVELEILDEFKRICDKYEISYSLCGGTLLGAVRHAGFIPWDDDIDVLMLRKDYDKFIEIAKKELDTEYCLDSFETNKNYFNQFAKIKKNNTIFDEKKTSHLKNHKGIFIDIFPLENVYENPKKSYYIAGIIKIIIDTVNYKLKITKLKNVRHKIAVLLFSLLSFQLLMKLSKMLACQNHDNNSTFVSSYYGVYPFYSELLKRDDFLPTKKIKFEGKEFQIMNNYDKYLSSLYGDYMKLPPKEKRINHMPEKIDFGDGHEN